jgi:hypothetical protein
VKPWRSGLRGLPLSSHPYPIVLEYLKSPTHDGRQNKRYYSWSINDKCAIVHFESADGVLKNWFRDHLGDIPNSPQQYINAVHVTNGKEYYFQISDFVLNNSTITKCPRMNFSRDWTQKWISPALMIRGELEMTLKRKCQRIEFFSNCRCFIPFAVQGISLMAMHSKTERIDERSFISFKDPWIS